MVATMHRLLPDDRAAHPSGPAAALYLWTYASSVVAHTAFFGRPGAALVGGVLMGLVAVPFAVALRRVAGTRRGERERMCPLAQASVRDTAAGLATVVAPVVAQG